MRRFTTLLDKEWRDVRTVTFACMLLVVVALLVLRWVLRETSPSAETDPNWGPRFFKQVVPFAVGAYAALIAADLVGGEVASRRADAFVLLPAPAAQVWCAKLGLLVGATFVFAAWTALAQIGCLWAVDGVDAVASFLESLDEVVWLGCVAAALTCATLFASTLRCRGIAALFVGVLLTGALGSAAYLYFEHLGFGDEAWNGWQNTVVVDHWRATLAAIAASVALVAGATASFCLGRVHLARVRRSFAWGLPPIAIVLGLSAVTYADHVRSADPMDPAVRLYYVRPSPDGRRLACVFLKTAPFPTSSVHVLDLETLTVRELQARAGLGAGSWVDATTLRIQRRAGKDGETVRVDVRDGTVSKDAEETPPDATVSVASPNGRWDIAGSRWEGQDGRTGWRFSKFRRGPDEFIEVRTRSSCVLLPDRRTVAYTPDDHSIGLRNLDDGSERQVYTGPESIKALGYGPGSADDPTVFVQTDGVMFALRIKDGSRVDMGTGFNDPQPAIWRGSSRRIVFSRWRGDPPQVFVDIDTGDRFESRGGAISGLEPSPTGGFFAVDHLGICIELDSHLKFVRRVWPQDAR